MKVNYVRKVANGGQGGTLLNEIGRCWMCVCDKGHARLCIKVCWQSSGTLYTGRRFLFRMCYRRDEDELSKCLNKFHGAVLCERAVICWLLCTFIKPLEEPEYPLLCSQEPATGRCPQPVESSLYFSFTVHTN